MKTLNIASWLTLSRLFLVPLAILPVMAGWHDAWLVAAAVTAVAGLTDLLDGYLARKTGQVSALGANLDRISDKVFVGILLLLLAWAHVIPLWGPIVVIIREVVISLVRLVRFHGNPPAPDVWGKTKTAISFVAILLAFAEQDANRGGILATMKDQWLFAPLSVFMPWIMFAVILLTVLSGLNYLVRYYRTNRQRISLEHSKEINHRDHGGIAVNK